MLAVESGAVSVVEVLVQRGADLSAVDSEGHDVIHYIKMSGSSEVKTALMVALNQHPVSGENEKHRRHVTHIDFFHLFIISPLL